MFDVSKISTEVGVILSSMVVMLLIYSRHLFDDRRVRYSKLVTALLCASIVSTISIIVEVLK